MGKSPEIPLLATPGPKRPEVPAVELSRPPEQLYVPHYAILTVAGRSSSGNSSFAKLIAAQHGISDDQLFSAGKVFRDYRGQTNPEQNYNSVEPIDRPAALDDDVDEYIAELYRNASIEHPQIVEAKLSGTKLRHLEQLGEPLPHPRISTIKWAPMKKRLFIARIKNPDSKLSDLKEYTKGRDKDDPIKWDRVPSNAYLRDYTNILDKNARDNEGRPLYQIVVDSTNHKSVEEDVDYFNEELLRIGLIEPIPYELKAGEDHRMPSQIT